MDDLISRSALLKKATGVVTYDEGGWDCNVRAVLVDDVLKAPAVDAETVIKSLPYVKEALEMAKQSLATVVRCKDCKHSYKGSPHGLMCECPVGGQNTSLLGDNDFCSCGERRTDE